MAKGRAKEEPGTNGDGKGKIKFRYMDSERALDFSIENVRGETVADSLKSIANTLAGRTIAPLKNPKGSLSSGPTVELDDEPETIQGDIEGEEEGTPEAEEEEGIETPAGPKRNRTPKAPTLLKDLNLNEAKVGLADFIAEKNPNGMLDKYAVIAVWYKEQFQVTDIDIDRIFTAFKFLGEESKLPTDIAKPLGNLTYRRKWFDRSKTKQLTFNLNWLGESEVGKMGGAAKS